MRKPSITRTFILCSMFCLLTSFLYQTPSVRGFEARVDVRAQDNKYYLVQLNASEPLWVNLTSRYGGDFNLYMSKSRPSDSGIMKNLVALDDGLQPDASLYYVANETRIYYIHIILNDSEPDTYILNASKELTQYFIPFLPGYPVSLTITAMTLSLAVIVLSVIRKKKRE